MRVMHICIFKNRINTIMRRSDVLNYPVSLGRTADFKTAGSVLLSAPGLGLGCRALGRYLEFALMDPL